MPVVQVIIDDSTNKTITGVWVFENGGKLAIPHGTVFPAETVAHELFWRDDESKLYKRNATNTAWDVQTAMPDLHKTTHEAGGSDEIQHQNLAGAGTNTHTQIDAHISNVDNPHSVTKAQVGLANVTNDAQLKRAADDFTSFTEKSSIAANDVLLLEDSEDSYNKKYVKISALVSGNLKQTVFAEITTDTTSTSNSWVDLLSLDITTDVGYLAIFASAGFTCSNATARLMGLRLVVDDTPIRAVSSASASTAIAESLSIINRIPVSSGAHTVKLQWRVASGYTIRCRPVTHPDDEHCSLLVVEVIA